MQIYAIGGISQIIFDCNNNNTYCNGMTVYCTPKFNESCIRDNNGYCNGFCNNYKYNITSKIINTNFAINKYYYNNSYIITSYSYQYYNDTIICNTSNICQIKCLHSYSCQYSIINFIANNSKCYLSCSYYACQYAIINTENCDSLIITINGNYGLYYGTTYLLTIFHF